MMRLSVAEELDIAISTAAREAEPGAPSRSVAETLYDSIPDLVEHFSREWIVEKLTSFIRRRRFKLRGETDVQLSLGFTVPCRILLSSGQQIRFGETTLWKLRLHRAQVWKQHRGDKHRAVANLDKAIDLMQKYASGQPGITYSEVLRKEAANRGMPVAGNAAPARWAKAKKKGGGEAEAYGRK